MFDKVRVHLYVRPKDDWALGIQTFRNGHKHWHLWDVNDDHFCTTFRSLCQRASIFRSKAFGIIGSPSVDELLTIGCESLSSFGNALQNVVIGLGDSEDRGLVVWNPSGSCQ